MTQEASLLVATLSHFRDHESNMRFLEELHHTRESLTVPYSLFDWCSALLFG